VSVGLAVAVGTGVLLVVGVAVGLGVFVGSRVLVGSGVAVGSDVSVGCGVSVGSGVSVGVAGGGGGGGGFGVPFAWLVPLNDSIQTSRTKLLRILRLPPFLRIGLDLLIESVPLLPWRLSPSSRSNFTRKRPKWQLAQALARTVKATAS
jgi:hypothetical protein